MALASRTREPRLPFLGVGQPDNDPRCDEYGGSDRAWGGLAAGGTHRGGADGGRVLRERDECEIGRRLWRLSRSSDRHACPRQRPVSEVQVVRARRRGFSSFAVNGIVRLKEKR